jgi:hypothetical protein
MTNKTKKLLAGALLTLTLVTGTSEAAFARQGRGADDPAGHVHHRRHHHEGANHR